ncbi:MAG: cell division protein FtsZ [Deltaproteobacteria bacterium]|nr:cell division protein FtsZ [Deltaproteobacteria bacterium]
MLSFDLDQGNPARIRVIGVGGAGNNAVNTMIQSGLANVEYITANTDAQALDNSLAQTHIQLGTNLTKGLGAGGDPEVGRNAAMEDQARVAEVLEGADMVFVAAGMGGGTGTGGAPVIAQVAKDCGALTVCVVTRPFEFEGRRRKRQAEEGMDELRQAADTIIVIPNQRLLDIVDTNVSMVDAFRLADSVLLEAVQGITDIITMSGFVNVDFADVRSIMMSRGMALMGTGRGTGEHRAAEAARAAVASPLLEDVAIDGATGVLINITGGQDMSIHEINEAARLISDTAHEDANIIFGAVVDEKLEDEIKVTVIATGFEETQVHDPSSSHQRRRGERLLGRQNRSVPAYMRINDEQDEPVDSRPAFGSAKAPVPQLEVGRATHVPPPPIATPAHAIEPPERRVTREMPAFKAKPGMEEDEYDIPTFLRKQVE